MWVYVPTGSTCSLSAQAEPGLISASSWQFPALEQSVWWRGKPSPSRTWFQRWKRVSWLQHLFGVMQRPSTAALGVEAWTASLAASRANLTVSQEENKANSITGISGARPGELSSKCARGSSSLRTSAGCSRQGLTKSLEPKGYGETYRSWASRLREDCLRRRKSARRTSANASSSLAWPTPSAAFLTGDDPVVYQQRATRLKERNQGKTGNGAGMTLATAANAWPTPTANDWKGSGPTLERKDGQMRGDRLDYAAEQLWSTPTAHDGRRPGPDIHSTQRNNLSRDASLWSTPVATDGEKGSQNQRRKSGGGLPLTSQAHQWMTPRVVSGTYTRDRGKIGSEKLTLEGQAKASPSFRQDRPISTVGEESSHIRRTLNPLFVEWLMGWPPGWTLAALTPVASIASVCSETALSAWRERMRSALLSIALPTAAPPAQLALFG